MTQYERNAQNYLDAYKDAATDDEQEQILVDISHDDLAVLEAIIYLALGGKFE